LVTGSRIFAWTEVGDGECQPRQACDLPLKRFGNWRAQFKVEEKVRGGKANLIKILF